MIEINKTKGYLFVEDDSSRTVGVMITGTGDVLLTRPSGTPGRVTSFLKIDRETARELARGILELVGEEDS